MRRLERTVIVAGLVLAAVWFVLHLLNVGGWVVQATGYKISESLLSVVPAWLAWRTSRVAGAPAVRRFARLLCGAWCAMTMSSTIEFVDWLRTGELSYPSTSPLVKICDVLVLVLVLTGLLTMPVRNRWSASRLRIGLDMATIQLAGMVFLWHFVIHPNRAGQDVGGAVAFALTAAGMVVLFALVRLVVGGVSEVSRPGLLLYVAAGVVNVLMGILQTTFAGADGRHFAFAAWAMFAGLLTAAEAVHLRSASAGARPVAPAARRPASLLPYFAVVAVHGLLLTSMRDGLSSGDQVVLGGAMLLTGLVMARQVVAMRDNSRLVVRLDDSVRALRRSMAREQVLGDLGITLLTTAEVAEMHRLAVRAAAAMLADCPGARAAVIAAAPNEPDVWLVTEVAAGADPAAAAGRRLPAGAIPAEILARLAGGEVVSLTDPAVEAHPALDPAGDAHPAVDPAGDAHPPADPAGLDRPRERPLVLLPLVSGERFFGVLSVSAPTALPADLRQSLEALRTQLSLALDSAALTAELTRRATHDVLTGVGNRALLRDRLTCALARAQRTGRPVGVLMLDLDGFKPINDTHGHDAGDEMLRVTAERLRRSVRTEDVVGRLGGDEFVVITEDLRSARDAIVVAERIVHALAVPVGHGRLRLTVSASIGIALSHSETTGADEMLRRADAAMYMAKRAGGGRYHLHGATDQAPVP